MENESHTTTERSLDGMKRIYAKYRMEISSIIGYCIASVVILIIIFEFVLPEYDVIDELSATGNAAYTKLNTLRDRGMNLSDFKSLARANNADIAFVLQDNKLAEAALAKPKDATGTYVDWVDNTLARIVELNRVNYENDLAISEMLPAYVTSDPSLMLPIQTRQINNTTFIEYIENNIIRQFNLTSQGNIGVEDVKFSDKESTINIGTYQLSLPFSGKNRDILHMLAFANSTGQFHIENGHIKSSVTSIIHEDNTTMPRNLLMNIIGLTMGHPLLNNDDINSGNITLEFYVKGLSVPEVYTLRDSIVKDLAALSKVVDTSSNICSRGTACQDEQVRLAVVGVHALQSSVVALQGQEVIKDPKRKLDQPMKSIQDLMKLRKSTDALQAQMSDYLATMNRKTGTTTPTTRTPASSTGSTSTGATNK